MTGVNHKEAERILREARTILDKKGWHKGGLTGPKGSVCLLQALQEVNHTVKESDRQEAKRLLLTLTGTSDIPAFNDRPKTTKEDIFLMLDAAANIAHEYTQE
jgi:hypothetical protein